VSWPDFWAGVFFASLAGFAIVSALIAVKGVSEIRELLDSLKHGRRKE
jgi:hypothetical protein